jgi:site-specific DNA recombinase
MDKNTDDKPLRVVSYTRLSYSQFTDGVSLAAQEERIIAYCTDHGMRLMQHYVDAGISAHNVNNRPALQAAIEHACRERAVLFVLSLSRLGSMRDVVNIAERLSKAGAKLVSLDDDRQPRATTNRGT